ncbi:hypothetical protein HPO96_24295 [Kribbella sandramycini]|uniref:Uncharacterized protein n=2 Tax=Kribbella sandramycini TaxID=60450 RepID=A0A7Y4P2S0_9ACTN|nr:hypothetical protein [Kribbella sandramycini]
MSRSSVRSPLRPRMRRIVARSAVALAALGVWATATAAAAGPSAPPAAFPSIEQRTPTVDGFVIEHLPGGIGAPSDFEYEWEDVIFHSRVWETGPDPQGAFKVDLTVKTLRGAKLTDLEALKAFLVEYEERDPATWQPTPLKVGPYNALTIDNEVFYFIEPGLAAEVSIDRDRFPEEELIATAVGFHPEP